MSTLAASAAAALTSTAAEAAPVYRTITPIAPDRIKELAAHLPAVPRVFGPPCKGPHRASWDALRTHPAFTNVVTAGETRLSDPFPSWNDDLFLEFSRNGRRPKGQEMIGARHAFLAPLVWAECLENKGRFVPRLEMILREYAAEKTWQRVGKAAAARILKSDFGESKDTFVMDLTAAYPPGTVETLVRTFYFDRTAGGSLTIVDEFTFPKGVAQTTETALTTHAEWKALTPTSFSFTRNGETLVATVEAPSAAGDFTTAAEVIEEDCLPFTRIGLRFN